MPIKEMLCARWIVAAAEPLAQLHIVLSFFGVAGVGQRNFSCAIRYCLSRCVCGNYVTTT